MKIRRITAFLSALSLAACFSGCSEKNESAQSESSVSEASETTTFELSIPDELQSKLDAISSGFYSVSGDDYEIDDFRFNISDHFKFRQDSDDTLIFQGKKEPILLAFTRSASAGNMTASAFAKGIAHSLDEKGIEAEMCKMERPDYECAYLKTNTAADDLVIDELGANVNCDYFCVRKERSLLSFIISYADNDEEAAYSYVNELLDNMEYTSEETIEGEPDIYENDYFIIEHDDKWFANNEGIADQYTESAKVRYSMVDDEALIYVGITLKGSSQIEEASSEERAEKSYESRKESAFSDNVKKEESEILGHKAVCVSMNVNLADNLSNYMRNYYFDENGKYYLISLIIPADDDGTCEKDVRELLEHIKLK